MSRSGRDGLPGVENTAYAPLYQRHRLCKSSILTGGKALNELRPVCI